MMKILVLGGGSGDVGRDVTRVLLKDKKFIDRITITSRRSNVAKNFAKELGDSRVYALQLDVTDRSHLVNAMKQHDIVVNTAGPFTKYGIPVMKAAIESKTNYIDICDDVEPTVEAIQLDKLAKDSGVFLLLSMGWFPGISNLRAKALADQMDDIEEIVIAWVAGRKSPEEYPSKGLAGVKHYLKALTGKIFSFRDGRRVKIPVRQKGIKLLFPDPLGKHTCYQIEHPETATLPYIIPGVKTMTVLGSLYPKKRNKGVRFFTRLIDLKILTVDFATKIIGKSMRSKKKVNLPMLNAAHISCIGKKDGKKGQLTYSECNTKVTTAEATSQPLACAIFYVAHGGIIEPGVQLPEEIFDINELIKIGKRYNLPFFTEVKKQENWSEEIISFKEFEKS